MNKSFLYIGFTVLVTALITMFLQNQAIMTTKAINTFLMTLGVIFILSGLIKKEKD